MTDRNLETRRTARAAGSTALWGGGLGAVLLGWSVLLALAPELASLIAVFGSPLLAFVVIVRMLTASQPAAHASPPTPVAIPEIRRRALAAAGNRCADCGADGPLTLRQVLPIGRATRDVERRFVVLCDACDESRVGGRRRGDRDLRPEAF